MYVGVCVRKPRDCGCMPARAAGPPSAPNQDPDRAHQNLYLLLQPHIPSPIGGGVQPVHNARNKCVCLKMCTHRNSGQV